MEYNKSLKIIQDFGKLCNLKNIQKNLNSSLLYKLETKSFAQLRKIQREPEIKELMKKLKNLLKLSDQDLRIIEMGIVMAWHPTNLFGQDKNKWHPQDNLMHQHCEFLIVNLVNLHNIKSLKFFLLQFIKIFNQWKEGDKHRTIEGIIISYYHRAEHIKKVKNDDKLTEIEKNLILETLNYQLNDLIKSLLMIDKNFPVDMLKDNHQKLFETYKKGWEYQFNNIRSVVVDSYLKHLKESIINGNYSNIRNEILAISNRLFSISPKKIIKSLKNKLSQENIDNIFSDDNPLQSVKLIKLLMLLIDTSIIFDSIDNDTKNQEWRNEIINKLEDLNENLPIILIEINKKIDDIINQIKNLSG